MNFTSEQILEKAKQILADLSGSDFDPNNLIKANFHAEEELIRGEDKGKEHPCWTVVIDVPLFNTTNFLIVSDESGEPLYIQSKHLVMEIERDSKGKYMRKE